MYTNTFFNNDLALILLAALFISRLKFMLVNNIFKAFIVNFLGVALHEMAHLCIGLILGAKPYWISLIPHKNSNGSYTMGYVEFSALNKINSFPTAMAPLLLLVLAYYLKIIFFQYFDWHYIPNQILYIIIMAIIVDNAIPSWQDFRVAFYFFGSAIIWCLILIIALIFLNLT